MTMVYLSLAVGVTLGFLLGVSYARTLLNEAKDKLNEANARHILVASLIEALNGKLTYIEKKEEEDETTDA